MVLQVTTGGVNFWPVSINPFRQNIFQEKSITSDSIELQPSIYVFLLYILLRKYANNTEMTYMWSGVHYAF